MSDEEKKPLLITDVQAELIKKLVEVRRAELGAMMPGVLRDPLLMLESRELGQIKNAMYQREGKEPPKINTWGV